VHQWQQDGKPGVYHINAVDTVTQWQVVGCTETISARRLIAVLEAMLHQFPFRILGFHCDAGSEFLGPIGSEHAGALQRLYTAHFNPVFEFPPSLWVRHRDHRRARQAAAQVPSPGLSVGLREAAVGYGN